MKKAHHPVNTTHTLEIVLNKVFEPNRRQEVILPALNAAVNADRNVSLLADGAAEAPCLVASSHVRERISEIVELAAVKELLGHVVLEPQDLGNFHLDAHGAANVLQQIVLRGVDLLRLLDGTVVQPENDIAVVTIGIVEIGAGYGDGLVGVVAEDGEGAGGVETDALDDLRVDLGLDENLLHAVADASPNI